jgi:Tol biopolymer transport system component
VRRLVAVLPVVLLLAACGGSGASAPSDLVFVSTRDGYYALYGVGASGGQERRLTKGRGDPSSPAGLFFETEPAWSSDGRFIAFASRRDGHSHIYVMRADGSDVRRLTSGPADDESPTWSPDGGRIAFARAGALYVVPAQGGRARRISRGLGGDAAGPAWSPSGRLIAYGYRRPGWSIQEIWIMRAGGGDPHQLTHLMQVSELPSWSPNGSHIAFQSNAHGRHFEIYSIGLDGRGLIRETRSSTDTIQPAWAPNGKEIAFSRGGAIWTVDRLGRERKITSGGNDSSPSWRPLTR